MAVGFLVLHIEDDDSDAQLAATALQGVPGVRVVRARMLADAAHLAALEPDIALLDLGLPDAHGPLDALHTFRGAFPEVPVVVLTGSSDTRLGRQAIVAGAEDYLSKDALGAPGLARRLLFAADRFQVRRALQRRQRQMEVFAEAVAHDIRGPLATLGSLLDLIEEGDPEALAAARTTLGTLNGTVDSLLERARGAHDQEATTDIPALMREVRTLVRPPAGFRILYDGDAPGVALPRGALTQVLCNLVANAIHHHDRDQGDIVVTADLEGGTLTLRVCDDGPGIPTEDRNRIFARGVSTGGTGLGLAIVQELVAAHGGHIRMEPSTPRGTTFIVAWPVTPRKTVEA